MRKNKTYRYYLLLIGIMGVVLLASCAGEEDLHLNANQHPISFASVEAEQGSMTRAAIGGFVSATTPSSTRATSPLSRDFIVYGYKNVGGIEQMVFDSYVVKYASGSASTSEDNTHGYYYVVGNQTIKYWDFAASEYHFWAVSAQPGVETEFSGEKHNILTIKDIPLRAGEPDYDDVYYSALNERRPVTSNVVQMQFKRPYAKVRIQFYTNQPIKNDKDNVYIKNITFGPDPDATSQFVNKIYRKGDVQITYPLTVSCSGNAEEAVKVIPNDEATQSAFLYDDVTLTTTLGISSNTAVTAPVAASECASFGISSENRYYYYPLPMGDLNPAFIMQANIDEDVNPGPKTAVVPSSYMQWKPNYLYTYIFKVTEARTIEFYDVKIEPWHYGGMQTEEWRNW